jgi:hypothetical protein
MILRRWSASELGVRPQFDQATWNCRPVADADHLPKRTLGIGDLEQAFAALAG